MRPHPLVPSPRRTLATLSALLISAALSLGFAPLSPSLLLGNDAPSSTLAKEPCDVEKVAAAGAAVTTANTLGSTASSAAHAATPAASTSRPELSSASRKLPAPSPAAKAPADSPVGLLQSCPGVRPGGIVTSDDGLCTYNFVFTDGVHRYIGTAGHCILEGPQISAGSLPPVERTWTPAAGPVARDVDGNRVGVFVYGIRSDAHDFALIRLDHNVPVNPAMCHFGGPTGINNDLVSETVTLHYYGNGQGVSALAPGRSALALDMSDPNQVPAYGLAVPGDSGAGVISEDGRAVGNISSDVVGLSTIFEGILHIPRITPQIEAAERALGVNLELVTAPLE
ncbi:MAG: S1 family peptidase [Actinomycetota bacterium]|nr:S1 family peptidase [Actinomycetota bacterium]